MQELTTKIQNELKSLYAIKENLLTEMLEFGHFNEDITIIDTKISVYEDVLEMIKDSNDATD